MTRRKPFVKEAWLHLIGNWNRKKESRMAVAKRQGREKSVKIEQRKV